VAKRVKGTIMEDINLYKKGHINLQRGLFNRTRYFIDKDPINVNL
jgi:hypothetical protein